MACIKGPQQDLKRIAAWLLKKRGFEVKGCEITASGGLVDIIGAKGEKRILVECGPCRIDKAICYLDKPDTIMWVLARDRDGAVLHEITRDKNWDSFLEFHKNEHFRLLKDAISTAKL